MQKGNLASILEKRRKSGLGIRCKPNLEEIGNKKPAQAKGNSKRGTFSKAPKQRKGCDIRGEVQKQRPRRNSA